MSRCRVSLGLFGHSNVGLLSIDTEHFQARTHPFCQVGTVQVRPKAQVCLAETNEASGVVNTLRAGLLTILALYSRLQRDFIQLRTRASFSLLRSSYSSLVVPREPCFGTTSKDESDPPACQRTLTCLMS